MRKVLVTPILAGLTGLAALAVPATAQAADAPTPTVVTLAITTGPMTITEQPTAGLTGIVGGVAATGQLGLVTVADARGSDPGSWAATVTSTDFTTTGGTVHTIPVTDVTYTPNIQTSATGTTGAFTPGAGGTFAAVATSLPAFSALGELVASSVTWNPTLTVKMTAADVGDYHATILHSVV